MAEPAIIVVYGDSGRGKSVDALYTVPDALYLTPAPGGLAAAIRLTGIKPREQRVNTIEHACKVLRDTHGIHAVVLDDFSVLAERTHLSFDSTGHGGWDVWKRLQRSVMALREVCIDRGLTLVMNAHVSPPKTDDGGNSIPGGPKMPSKAMTMALPHVATLVLRAESDAFIAAPQWPGRYACDPTNAQWVTKDRYVVIQNGKAPQNVREILWAAKAHGHDVVVPPRAKGLEALDDLTESLSQGLARGTLSNAQDARKAIATQRGKFPPHVLHWAWRDGLARHALANADLFADLT
jgi:hypothetical protein